MSAQPQPSSRLGAIAAMVVALVLGWWASLAVWLNPAEAVENLSDWQYEALCFVMRVLGMLLVGALLIALVLLQVKAAVPGGVR